MNLFNKATPLVFCFLSVFVNYASAEEGDLSKSLKNSCQVENKELTFIFQKQKRPDEIKKAADLVSEYLSNEIKIPVKAVVPSDYTASVQALVSKKADFAYLSSLPFLLARRDGNAQALLVEERKDPQGNARTEYDSVLVALKSSPLNSIEDIAKNAKELRVVFTSPTSTSGYIFPYSRFVDEKIMTPGQDPKQAFKSAHFGGGYTQAVDEVLQGRADFAAVSYYVVEGAEAAAYYKEDKLSQLKVIARTPGVPTHMIAAKEGLPECLKEKISQALIKMGSERPELLKDVYGTSTFVRTEENKHVLGTVKAVERIKLPIDKLM
jgi:phosphonate transport system substrate-binding protein